MNLLDCRNPKGSPKMTGALDETTADEFEKENVIDF